MTWTDVWMFIGSIFEWCFKVMRKLGNAPNAILWVLIFILVCGWIWKMGQQNKEAARNGTLK
jgi:hypothetical protein